MPVHLKTISRSDRGGVSRASAPASIGNVGIGFDVLGQAFDAVRDTVTAHREADPGVRLGTVSGLVDRLPADVARNTALAAAASLLQAAGAPFGVTLDIHKGVPVSAGMGGSAASAVAAVVAVNALLPEPLSDRALLRHALEGERVSADPPPWDNVMASLLGGLVMAAALDPAHVRSLPTPEGIACVLVHPDLTIETQAARSLLGPQVPLAEAVDHGRRLAGFVAGCCSGDLALIRACLDDRLIEPQRAPLLPGFADIKRGALAAGALGMSFSGSGPALFAWVVPQAKAAVRTALLDGLAAQGLTARAYEAPIASAGARLEADACAI